MLAFLQMVYRNVSDFFTKWGLGIQKVRLVFASSCKTPDKGPSVGSREILHLLFDKGCFRGKLALGSSVFEALVF